MGFRIAVVGSGAIGSYYGAKLANAGSDVHFLKLEHNKNIVKANSKFPEVACRLSQGKVHKNGPAPSCR